MSNTTIITKELHAVFLDGKQITRYRNDKVRTIAIAKRTNWNLNEGPFKSKHHKNVGVLSRKVQKKTDDTRSFAILQTKPAQIYMIATKEQQEELKKAAQPLMDWLKDNCHPHYTAIVDSERTQLVEGISTAVNTNPVKD